MDETLHSTNKISKHTEMLDKLINKSHKNISDSCATCEESYIIIDGLNNDLIRLSEYVKTLHITEPGSNLIEFSESWSRRDGEDTPENVEIRKKIAEIQSTISIIREDIKKRCEWLDALSNI